MIPVLGGMAQEIAYSQHEQGQAEMNLYVEQKIAAEAKQQVDEEANARLQRLNESLDRRVLQPLSDLSLSTTVIDAHTTRRRATMRLRLAGEDQIAGHTPRPRALANSLASCQIHESALNNALQRMELAGGTFVAIILIHGIVWLEPKLVGMVVLADVFAAILSLVSIVLGAGTFGAWRIPAHALVHVADKPNPLLGCAAILLAVVTLCSLVMLPLLLW